MDMTKQGDLTAGPLPAQIFKFSVPLIFSNLLQVLFNMADIAVVGRFGGENALGAVGSSAIFVTLFTSFLIGFSNGVNALTALGIGANDHDNVKRTVNTSFAVCFLMGVVMLVFGDILTRPVLLLMKTKKEFLDGAVTYIRIYFAGMPASAVFNCANAVFSAAGNTKKPLVCLSAAGVANIVLNLFFVIVCKMDVAGVGAASALSQYLSAFLILHALSRVEDDFGFRISGLRVDPSKITVILRIGITSAAQFSIFQVANLFVQAGINSFDALTVEGNTVATNADAPVYDVMSAFYVACSSFMGQNYGARIKKRVRNSYFISLAYSFGIGIILGLTLFFLGPRFLGLFTTDPAVIESGLARLRIMGLCYGFSAFMDCTIAASRGLGKTAVPTLIVLIGSCVLRVVWIYTVFAHFHTIETLYLVYIVTWAVTATFEIIYFIHIYRATVF